MILAQPIIINFRSEKEIQLQSYDVILATVNDAFHAAKGNLVLMRNIEMLAKELRYMAALQIDELERGPVPAKHNVLPEAHP